MANGMQDVNFDAACHRKKGDLNGYPYTGHFKKCLAYGYLFAYGAI